MIKMLLKGYFGFFALNKAFQYFIKEDEVYPSYLGSFVVWGRPNSGKTTFISRLCGQDVGLNSKEATTSKKKYKNIKFKVNDGTLFTINEIVDMPGTMDRLDDWLMQVMDNDHVFYLIDLSRLTDRKYISQIEWDVRRTIEALGKSNKECKRINIIATHIDESQFRQFPTENANNILQDNDVIRQIYETTSEYKVSGYVYSANLMDKDSFQRLMESVINDCQK